MNKLKALVVVLASLGLAGLFLAGVRFHASTMEREVASDPLATNLRSGDLRAKLRFGESPKCGADGHECWAEREVDERDWNEVPFPLPSGYDVRVQAGAAKAMGAWAYYRVKVPVSPALLASGEEIGFTPMYVSHERFEILVDGRSMYRGGAKEKLFLSATATIPREAVEDGYAVVTIKGSLDPAHSGISHRGGVYVGPRRVVDLTYVHVERAMGSYFLLYLVAKASIFVVFALFFLFNPGQRGLGPFLVYAFFGTLEHLFSGDFLDVRIGFALKIAALFGAKTIAVLALGIFWMRFYGVVRWPRAAWALAWALAAAVFAVALAVGRGQLQIAGEALFAMTDDLLLAVVAGGLALGARRLRLVPDARSMLIVSGVYLALLVWEFAFHTFVGFDKRPVFDLLLFYYLALVTAKQQREELAKARAHAAIAQMTQMLAHDVRKPFTILRAALGDLKADAAPAVRHTLARVAPEVERAMASVDGMVADIMEIGAPSRLHREPVGAEELLLATLQTVFRPRPEARVVLHYNMGLERKLDVDPLRVGRALANIVENALQAMKLGPDEEGHLWFRTREAHGQALLTLGNAGSFIPEADRERIFEAFYTHGKKGGTGLGLAIARKAARDHGGDVWCTADEEKGTEFHLRLPLSDQRASPLPDLPRHARDLKNLEGSVPGTEGSVPGAAEGGEIGNDLVRGSVPGTEGSVPEIILVEDSPFLRDAWAEATDMRVHTYSGPSALLAGLARDPSLLSRVACVVTDFHFGDVDPDANGHDVAREIRKRAPGLPVLVATETPELAAVGGDAFDGALDKLPPPWPALARRLRRKNNGAKSTG